MRCTRSFAILILAVSFAAFAANLGIVEGTVLGEGGAPPDGAKVQLLTRDGRQVDEHTVDPAGHFEFEQVPFGSYRLRAIGPGGAVAEQEVRVASGDVVVASISLRPAAEQQLVVQGTRPLAPAPAKVPSSVSSLDRQQIEELPRGDTQSVNEILATQPGFVYDAMGNLFARGNHANIQYQLDGVPLPDSVSGLFGGFLSPKMIDGKGNLLPEFAARGIRLERATEIGVTFAYFNMEDPVVGGYSRRRSRCGAQSAALTTSPMRSVSSATDRR